MLCSPLREDIYIFRMQVGPSLHVGEVLGIWREVSVGLSVKDWAFHALKSSLVDVARAMERVEANQFEAKTH